MIAWPTFSQNVAQPDSVKVARLDLISAAEELEAFDRLKIVDAVTTQLIQNYSRENTALQLQNSTKAAQIDLLNKAYKILETESEALKAQKKPKFTLLTGLLIITAFLGGLAL